MAGPVTSFHQKSMGKSKTVNLPRLILRRPPASAFVLGSAPLEPSHHAATSPSYMGRPHRRKTKAFQSIAPDNLAKTPEPTPPHVSKLSQTFWTSRAYRWLQPSPMPLEAAPLSWAQSSIYSREIVIDCCCCCESLWPCVVCNAAVGSKVILVE